MSAKWLSAHWMSAQWNRLGDSRLSESRLSGMRPKYGGGHKELALMHGKADMDKDCVKGCKTMLSTKCLMAD